MLGMLSVGVVALGLYFVVNPRAASRGHRYGRSSVHTPSPERMTAIGWVLVVCSLGPVSLLAWYGFLFLQAGR